MILVDFSVWIDYFNGTATSQTDFQDRILGEQPILVGDLILAEVLQGFLRDEDFDAPRRALLFSQVVERQNPDLADQSSRNYRILHAKGIAVRKTIDCIIATYCIQMGHAVLHSDGDFDPFETHLGLSVVHP